MRLGMVGAVVCLLGAAGCEKILPPLDQIIMEPNPKITLTPTDFGYGYKQTDIDVTYGRTVSAWYVPTPQPKAVIVVIPGSSSNKSLYVRLALPILGDQGYDLLFMDYEGYGDSPGTPTLQHAADDALAVTRYAMGLNEKVVVFGISMGSPLAARAAAEFDVTAMVLESSLIVPDVLTHWLGTLTGPEKILFEMVGPDVIRQQLPADFNILASVARAHGAKLIVQSPDDELTPFASALEVYDTAPPPKVFWQTYGGHGMMIRLEPDVYARTLSSWLEAVLNEAG